MSWELTNEKVKKERDPNHEKPANKIVLEKFKLNSFKKCKIYNSDTYAIYMIRNFPYNKGHYTKKFKKWPKDFVDREIEIAMEHIFKNPKFKSP